jgi:thioredoxin 1
MSRAKEVTLESFQEEVFDSTVPVVVDFYADWCAPCRMLGPILDEVSSDYAGRAKIVKVNIDSEPGLASQFNVTSIPTLAFVVNGEVIGQSTGLPSTLGLKRVLDQMTSMKTRNRQRAK